MFGWLLSACQDCFVNEWLDWQTLYLCLRFMPVLVAAPAVVRIAGVSNAQRKFFDLGHCT